MTFLVEGNCRGWIWCGGAGGPEEPFLQPHGAAVQWESGGAPPALVRDPPESLPRYRDVTGAHISCEALECLSWGPRAPGAESLH